MPDTWVPTSTFVTGSMVPVAVIEVDMSPLDTFVLVYVTMSPSEQAASANIDTAAAVM